MTQDIEITFNAKQQQFLSSNADILLMGGGAGSGKSLAAVFALLGLNDPAGPRISNPDHRALIYRKHYKDLKDIVNKTRKYYPLVAPGAKLNKSELTWTFPSGAEIVAHYFERIDDAEDFLQGQEYDTILCDEIGQYEDDRVFKYALSRNRNSAGIANQFLATSNPSKYKWLRDFFHIDDAGNSTMFDMDIAISDDITVKKHVRYIQAKLEDNPYIPDDYAATLALMSEEDKRALWQGRWDAYDSIDGQIYKDELYQLQVDKRCCRLPCDRSLPVYTAWDIGIDDSTCILFMQFVGKERHIIDMILDNNKGMRDYYIPEVLKRIDTHGYRYAAHYLPHDSAQRDKFSGTALFAQISSVLPNCKPLNIASVEAGIQYAKAAFKSVWIDSECGLIDQLVNYKRKWHPLLDRFGEPLHDRYSHAGDAFRYLMQVKDICSAYKEINDRYSKPNQTASANPFVRTY